MPWEPRRSGQWCKFHLNDDQKRELQFRAWVTQDGYFVGVHHFQELSPEVNGEPREVQPRRIMMVDPLGCCITYIDAQGQQRYLYTGVEDVMDLSPLVEVRDLPPGFIPDPRIPLRP